MFVNSSRYDLHMVVVYKQCGWFKLYLNKKYGKGKKKYKWNIKILVFKTLFQYYLVLVITYYHESYEENKIKNIAQNIHEDLSSEMKTIVIL